MVREDDNYDTVPRTRALMKMPFHSQHLKMRSERSKKQHVHQQNVLNLFISIRRTKQGVCKRLVRKTAKNPIKDIKRPIKFDEKMVKYN